MTLIGVCMVGDIARAAESKEWTRSPYRIHLTIGVDASSRPQPRLRATIAKGVSERVDAVIGPLWQMDLDFSDTAPARRACFELNEIAWNDLPTELKTFDKLMWLGLRASPEGYKLRCREFDLYTRTWGPVHERFVRQASLLPEASFAMLRRAFSPLASIQAIANDDKHVRLMFKGSELPQPAKENILVSPGDAFQPLLRRTDRSGKLVENGVMPVPFTFLAATEPAEDAWLAEIFTGTRRPFGAEPRPRIEQIALAIHNPPGPVRVRFHARSDKNQGLAGYEVFQATNEGDTELVGLTDRNGVVAIQPSAEKILILLLRSDGQLLAKAPVPSGTGARLEIPVADGISRLRAQAEAQVVREQLVDVVARRTIIMARIRALLKKNKTKEAADLMDELDSLPTSSVFGRNLDVAARKIPASNDPAVQRSIDKLFSTTRELLGKFLSNRPIIDLQAEVNAASRGGS
jgi:hypothetical protein